MTRERTVSKTDANLLVALDRERHHRDMFRTALKDFDRAGVARGAAAVMPVDDGGVGATPPSPPRFARTPGTVPDGAAAPEPSRLARGSETTAKDKSPTA